MSDLPSYIRTLAVDLRQAVERYDQTARCRCPEGCPCPLSEALRSARALVADVARYDAGELVLKGLPSFPPEDPQPEPLSIVPTPPEND